MTTRLVLALVLGTFLTAAVVATVFVAQTGLRPPVLAAALVLLSLLVAAAGKPLPSGRSGLHDLG